MWIPSKNHKYGWNSKFLDQKQSVLVTQLRVVCVNFKSSITQSENNMCTKIKINCSYNTTLCLEIAHTVV